MMNTGTRQAWRAAAVGMAAVLSLGASANAQTFDDIEFWVGSGENRAALVIDWRDGKNLQSLVWGFRWDGTATGEDMFKAVVNADDRLFANVSTPGAFGVSVYGLGYDVDNSGGFAVTPPLAFDAGGLSIGTAVDGRDADDADDHWQEGFFSDGFWGYYLGGTAAAPTWESSLEGITDRVLTNNSWDGLSYAVGFDFVAPSAAVAASVPVPGTAVVLGLSGLAAVRRRRKA